MGVSIQKRLPRAIVASLKKMGIPHDATILVALSGGPDSVALLHAMLAVRDRIGCRIAAAHLNHQIRGDESDRDEAFVRALCSRCQIDLIVERARGLSADMPNLEERAREARHAFLNASADRIGANYIALAHHADDQAETVLMRLLRGTGASGLAAIAEKGPGRIIRPLLAVTRDEVTAYLKSIGEGFMSDSSNRYLSIQRNRVRGELMPMLEQNYAPGLRGRLVALASEMRALDDFVSATARRELEANLSEDGLNITRFADFHPALQAELIRQYIKCATGNLRRIERVHIEAVRRLCLDGSPHGSLDIPGVRIWRRYQELTVAANERELVESFVVRLNPGVVDIPETGFQFEMKEIPRAAVVEPVNKFEALFDGSLVGQLLVRSFRRGDRVAPIGMNGHRKVKDIFIDHKLEIGRRATFPIVEINGSIAWIPGMVRGCVGLITERTQRVLHVRASSANCGHH